MERGGKKGVAWFEEMEYEIIKLWYSLFVDKNKYFSDVAILISAMLNILSRESNLLIISYTGFLFVARVTLFGTKEFFELTVNALKLILVM